MLDRLLVTLAAGDDGLVAVNVLITLALIVAGSLGLYWVIARRLPQAHTGGCESCGYDLRGVRQTAGDSGLTCPECGHRNTSNGESRTIASDRSTPD